MPFGYRISSSTGVLSQRNRQPRSALGASETRQAALIKAIDIFLIGGKGGSVVGGWFYAHFLEGPFSVVAKPIFSTKLSKAYFTKFFNSYKIDTLFALLDTQYLLISCDNHFAKFSKFLVNFCKISLKLQTVTLRRKNSRHFGGIA